MMHFKRLLILCFIVSISNIVYASNTIEVYLNHGMELSGVEETKSKGINITYYYLDDIEKIEDQMSKRATAQLQDEINSIVKEIGLKKLSAMNEFERNQVLLKQMKSSQVDLQDIRHTLVTSQDREAIKQAQEVISYAQDQGVTNDMLPAIIFKGRLLKNTHDITAAFKTRKSQK